MRYLPLLIIIFLAACGSPDREVVAERIANGPNVILILADDLGYGDLAIYGHPYALTPNLDRLAAEGLRLQRFYAAGVTCAPSRAAFMTGIHPASFDDYPTGRGLEGRQTITEAFKRGGYTVGHFGKWHIGRNADKNRPPYGIDVLDKGKGEAELRDADVFAKAIEFIERNDDAPFYLNIWTHLTHFPVTDATPEMRSRYANLRFDERDFGGWYREEKINALPASQEKIDRRMTNYLGAVSALDDYVGRLLEALDRAGVANNTIVVFTSDHGPELIDTSNDRGENAAYVPNMMGYAGGLRGGKHSAFEGGVRVPFIIRWPGKVPAGAVDSTSVVSALDWLPSVTQMAGVSDLTGLADGMDRSQVLFGAPDPKDRELYWSRGKSESVTLLSGQYKIHGVGTEHPSLYDLRADPQERVDISEAKPEVLHDLARRARRIVSGKR